MPHEPDRIMLTTEDVVCTILELLKSNGTFDELRRDCVSEIINKKRFETLTRLTETLAAKYLSTLKFTPELNKNSIREELRQFMFEGYESREINNESNIILNQVFETGVIRNFESKIKFVVNQYLRIRNDGTTEMNGTASGINVNNLISIITDSTNSGYNQVLACDINNEAEIDSPEFEPLFSSLYNDDSYNGDVSGTSGSSGTVTSTVDLKSKHSLEINLNCLEPERQEPLDESNNSKENSNEQQGENNKPSCHIDQENTHVIVKDPLLATKEKWPNTTNNDQSDDVVSSRQRSTCNKIRKSLTTMICQSIKKNCGNKDNMDELQDHLLKNSKNFKAKKNKSGIIKKYDKMSTNDKKTDSKLYDYRSSSFSNDDQEAAEVLIAMGSIPCKVFNNDKTEIEYRLTSHSDNKNNTQNSDKQSGISHNSKHVGKTVKNKDKLDATCTYNQILRKEHVINNNNCTNDIHLKQKVKSVALDNIEICDKNELASSNLKNKKDKKTIIGQDEITVVTDKEKFQPALKKKKHLNCNTTIDAIKTDNVSNKHTVQPSSELVLGRPSTSRGSDPILKSKVGKLYWGTKHDACKESKNVSINHIIREMSTNDINKNPKTSGNLSLNKFAEFNNLEAEPCKVKLGVIANLISNPNGFIGFSPKYAIPCKNREKVFAELVKSKNEKEEFSGFSEQDVQVCLGYEHVKQHLEKTEKEISSLASNQDQAVDGCNETQNGQATVIVESGNIVDIQANNKPTNSVYNDNAKMNIDENASDSSQWIAEQIRKYKISPSWVKLERLADFNFTVPKGHPDSRQACYTWRTNKKKKPKTQDTVIISSDED